MAQPAAYSDTIYHLYGRLRTITTTAAEDTDRNIRCLTAAVLLSLAARLRRTFAGAFETSFCT
jgi:hypothetical protein